MTRAPVTPSLYVPDLAAALRYYTDTLGFAETAAFEEDGQTFWAEVSLGPSRLWFFATPLDGHPKPSFSRLIYVFIDDVDAVAARLKGHVPFEWGPETQPYGLRELGIKDLNGYYLVFAKDV
ncbi:MAG: VOC family protein [Alphaproteobacteria bacterium]|nr:VOC family protein [Alphaproteobacteria bacterium]